MDISVMIFISSGLFLGWSLGANDAANIFGTAVGSKMIRFGTAAFVASFFIILGALFSGQGAAYTLGELGSVNEIAGAFIVALGAGVTVLFMTRLSLPVSTSQAIVGGIVGWNIFSGSLTDRASLSKIVFTWIACPILTAIFSIAFYYMMRWLLGRLKIHLLKLDFYNRAALLIAGALGAYSLGANNIANVMGVFVPVSPFGSITVMDFTFTGVQQLFFIGAAAISVGVYTYSKKVMGTVGSQLVKLRPETALVVVLSTAIVLFLFASERLETWLIGHGLPAIPLVPVSSSQAVVGAVVGIGLARGRHGINVRLLGKIASGWVTTPLIAGLISFVSLFFLQNVFNQKVYRPVPYMISSEVVIKLTRMGTDSPALDSMKNVRYETASDFMEALEKHAPGADEKKKLKILKYSKLWPMTVDARKIEKEIKKGWLSKKQGMAVYELDGMYFERTWQLHDELSPKTAQWKLKADKDLDQGRNKKTTRRLRYLYRTFKM